MPPAWIPDVTLSKVDVAFTDEVRLEKKASAEALSLGSWVVATCSLEVLFGAEEWFQWAWEKHPGRSAEVETSVACPTETDYVGLGVDVGCFQQAVSDIQIQLPSLSTSS